MVVLAVVLLAGCGGGDDEAEVVGSTTASSAPSTASAPADPARLTFRPVLVPMVPCESGAASTIPVTGSDLLPVDDPAIPGSCDQVGPVGFDGTAIATATATAAADAGGADGWQVVVEVAEASRDQAAALFDGCFAADPTCPDTGPGHGQVAVVLDDRVVSAPSVAAAGLADGELVISGTFTRAEAEDLAAILSS